MADNNQSRGSKKPKEYVMKFLNGMTLNGLSFDTHKDALEYAKEFMIKRNTVLISMKPLVSQISVVGR